MENTGNYLLLYIFALFFLYKERKKDLSMIVFAELMILIIICNPFSGYIIYKCLAGSYFRIFWILQFVTIVAFVCVRFEETLNAKYKKTIFYFSVIFLIIAGGHFMFSSQNYTKSPNYYKIPEEIIEICSLVQDKSHVKIAAPTEVAIWIRQYTANIHMAFGRYDGDTELKTLIDNDTLQLQTIYEKAKEDECSIVILPQSKILMNENEMKEIGFQYYSETENYKLYSIVSESLSERRI